MRALARIAAAAVVAWTPGIASPQAAVAAMAVTAPTAAAAQVPRPDDFAYGMEIATGDGPVSPAWRVALPLEVYRGLVRADRGDLRVFNARGEVVPHQLRRPATIATARPAAVALPLFPLHGDPARAMRALRIRIQAGTTAVSLDSADAPVADTAAVMGATPATGTAPAAGSALAAGTAPAAVARPAAANAPAAGVAPAAEAAPVASYLVDARNMQGALEAFVLRWPPSAAQFVGRLELEASDDLDAWRRVGGGTIANLAAGEARLIENRLEIVPTRARYWRLGWAGTPAPFVFEALQAEPAGPRSALARATHRIVAQPVAARAGEFTVDLGLRLPVDRVNVVLPEANTVARATLSVRDDAAQPWTPLIADLPLYRLQVEGRELQNASRELPTTPSRWWRIELSPPGVLDGATPPQLEVAWPPHELWFVARGPGPYLLTWGSATAQPAEVTLDAILPTTDGTVGEARVAVATAALGARRTLGGEPRRVASPPPFPWRSALLWAVLALGVLVLGVMAWKLARETGRGEGESSTPP